MTSAMRGTPPDVRAHSAPPRADRKRWPVGVTLLVGACLGSCAPVKPYERGIHSKRVMQTDPDPAERRLDTHTHEIREGSMSDPSLSGGGCGCN